jgi:integrase/recombinase XerD
MSGFRAAAADYLAIRRAVGFKLRRAEGLLFSFVGFLEAEQAIRVTTQLALRWATLPTGSTPEWHSARLCVVRGFARHMSALDPETEVPPTGLLGRSEPGSSRPQPYLYSPAEVTALMAATRSIRSRFVATTYETLIGLLSATGVFSTGRPCGGS